MSKRFAVIPTLPSSIYSVDRNMMHHAPTLGGLKGMCLSLFAKILSICAIFVPFTEFK